MNSSNIKKQCKIYCFVMKSLSNLIVLNEDYSQNQEEIQIDKEEILIDDYFVFNQRSAISRKDFVNHCG